MHPCWIKLLILITYSFIYISATLINDTYPLWAQSWPLFHCLNLFITLFIVSLLFPPHLNPISLYLCLTSCEQKRKRCPLSGQLLHLMLLSLKHTPLPDSEHSCSVHKHTLIICLCRSVSGEWGGDCGSSAELYSGHGSSGCDGVHGSGWTQTFRIMEQTG